MHLASEGEVVGHSGLSYIWTIVKRAQFLHFIKETNFSVTNESLPQSHISEFKT